MVEQQLRPQQCLLTITAHSDSELYQNVEKLWQLDVLPYRKEKLVTRCSSLVTLLDAKTTRVEVKGVLRYATPLLRREDMPCFQAPKEAAMPSLRSTERRLAKDPER